MALRGPLVTAVVTMVGLVGFLAVNTVGSPPASIAAAPSVPASPTAEPSETSVPPAASSSEPVPATTTTATAAPPAPDFPAGSICPQRMVRAG